MSCIGGYQIIDLKNMPFSQNSEFTIDGIYEKIEGTGKAILVSGFQYDGKEYHDFFAYVGTSDSNYVIKSYGKTITITSDDVVTVTLDG